MGSLLHTQAHCLHTARHKQCEFIDQNTQHNQSENKQVAHMLHCVSAMSDRQHGVGLLAAGSHALRKGKGGPRPYLVTANMRAFVCLYHVLELILPDHFVQSCDKRIAQLAAASVSASMAAYI